MIGNWTDWKCQKWNGRAYVFERVRAYRSWFGFIREERERKSFPGRSEDCCLALLNEKRLMPAEEHYGKMNAVREERDAALKKRDEETKRADSLVFSSSHLVTQLVATKVALADEQRAYAELLKAVQATKPSKAKPARGRRGAGK